MFTHLPDLAARRLGGAVIAANDDFFAPKEGLIKPGPPEWREGVYTDRGKWMDGWETRRRRTPGHDWAIIKLGIPGIVRGVIIDTTFYTGNYPEYASIDASWLPTYRRTDVPTSWKRLLPKTPLEGNTINSFAISRPPVLPSSRLPVLPSSHLRLNIFPDGGVARLRVYGEAVPDESVFKSGRKVDLAAMKNGGLVVSCSDMHYGHPQNLIQPGRSTHMGDGWETRRRRGPGHDWSIIRLARRGVIERIELDTDHYKGNAPGKCMLEFADAGDGFDPASARWRVLVPRSPLMPHERHNWDASSAKPATHVRLNIYPDGGVARLRLFGRAAE
jgi:allantoicase